MATYAYALDWMTVIIYLLSKILLPNAHSYHICDIRGTWECDPNGRNMLV